MARTLAQPRPGVGNEFVAELATRHRGRVVPLAGSLAGSLGGLGNADPATLAAIGQMGAIWVGGGTLAATVVGVVLW